MVSEAFEGFLKQFNNLTKRYSLTTVLLILGVIILLFIAYLFKDINIYVCATSLLLSLLIIVIIIIMNIVDKKELFYPQLKDISVEQFKFSLNTLIENKHAIVLHNINKISYSNYLSQLAERNRQSENIISVFGLEPSSVIDTIFTDTINKDDVLRKYKLGSTINSNTIDTLLERITEDDFYLYEKRIYPHFDKYRVFAEYHPQNITRVLIANTLDENEWIEKNRKYFKFLKWLNGNNIKFLFTTTHILNTLGNSIHSDYTVINSKLWVDYYEDSHTLIITHIPSTSVLNTINEKSIISHFTNIINNIHMFTPFDEIIDSSTQ